MTNALLALIDEALRLKREPAFTDEERIQGINALLAGADNPRKRAAEALLAGLGPETIQQIAASAHAPDVAAGQVLRASEELPDRSLDADGPTLTQGSPPVRPMMTMGTGQPEDSRATDTDLAQGRAAADDYARQRQRHHEEASGVDFASKWLRW
jgi:hypothetical protein